MPKARGWLRFAHTGELGGLTGQIIAGIGCLGGVFLVYTGFALAVRRLVNWSIWKRSPKRAPAYVSSGASLPVSSRQSLAEELWRRRSDALRCGRLRGDPAGGGRFIVRVGAVCAEMSLEELMRLRQVLSAGADHFNVMLWKLAPPAH